MVDTSSIEAAAKVVSRTGEAAKSGPIGFAIVLVLCIACYFLFKSMSKHLKTVREDFPTKGGEPVASRAVPPSPVRAERVADQPAEPSTPSGDGPATPGS